MIAIPSRIAYATVQEISHRPIVIKPEIRFNGVGSVGVPPDFRNRINLMRDNPRGREGGGRPPAHVDHCRSCGGKVDRGQKDFCEKTCHSYRRVICLVILLDESVLVVCVFSLLWSSTPDYRR